MELLDSVDKEFNEYEKIYLCSGVAIALLDEMIRDITKRSRPCNRNRIIITRFIKVLCRLNIIIQHDINQVNVAIEEFKSIIKREEKLSSWAISQISLVLDTFNFSLPEGLKLLKLLKAYLELLIYKTSSNAFGKFKDTISTLNFFKALSESLSSKHLESLKETAFSETKSNNVEIISPLESFAFTIILSINLIFIRVVIFLFEANQSKLFNFLSSFFKPIITGPLKVEEIQFSSAHLASQSVMLHTVTNAEPMKANESEKIKTTELKPLKHAVLDSDKYAIYFKALNSIISESESYRDDLLKFTTVVKSEEYLLSLLNPPKDSEDSKITLEIRKHVVDDLIALKKILMGVILETEGSSSIREMLEPKYRFYDVDGGFDRNISKIFLKSGVKTFYRCPGESVIFLHGEKEEEEFIAIFRTLCNKLSEKECMEIFCYSKESNLGVSENEECLKTVRTGDRTDENLINFHEQNENADEIIKRYGKMGKGTVSCILQLIIDSRRNNNNESVPVESCSILFGDIENGDISNSYRDDEVVSLKKRKSKLYTSDNYKEVKNYFVTAAHVAFSHLKLEKKNIKESNSELFLNTYDCDVNVFENDKVHSLPTQTNVTAETDGENETKQSAENITSPRINTVNIERVTIANRLNEQSNINNAKVNQLEKEILILFVVNFIILFPLIFAPVIFIIIQTSIKLYVLWKQNNGMMLSLVLTNAFHYGKIYLTLLMCGILLVIMVNAWFNQTILRMPYIIPIFVVYTSGFSSILWFFLPLICLWVILYVFSFSLRTVLLLVSLDLIYLIIRNSNEYYMLLQKNYQYLWTNVNTLSHDWLHLTLLSCICSIIFYCLTIMIKYHSLMNRIIFNFASSFFCVIVELIIFFITIRFHLFIIRPIFVFIVIVILTFYLDVQQYKNIINIIIGFFSWHSINLIFNACIAIIAVVRFICFNISQSFITLLNIVYLIMKKINYTTTNLTNLIGAQNIFIHSPAHELNLTPDDEAKYNINSHSSEYENDRIHSSSADVINTSENQFIVRDTHATLHDSTSNIADSTSNLTDSTSNIADSTSNIADSTSNIADSTSNIADSTSNIADCTSNLTDYNEFNTNPLIPAVYDLEVDFALIPLLSKNINNHCYNNNNNNNNYINDNSKNNNSYNNIDDNNKNDKKKKIKTADYYNKENNNFDDNNDDNEVKDMGSEVFMIEDACDDNNSYDDNDNNTTKNNIDNDIKNDKKKRKKKKKKKKTDNNYNKENNNIDDNNDNGNDNSSLEDMGNEVFMIEKEMSEDWMNWNANNIKIDTLIAKFGSTTGFTIGKFKGIGSITIANDKDIQYHNCIIIESVIKNCRFCLPGDSGSLYFALDEINNNNNHHNHNDNKCNNDINSNHYGKIYWKPIGIHRTSDSIHSSTNYSYACSFTECLKKLKEKKKIPDFSNIKIYCGLVKMSTDCKI